MLARKIQIKEILVSQKKFTLIRSRNPARFFISYEVLEVFTLLKLATIVWIEHWFRRNEQNKN